MNLSQLNFGVFSVRMYGVFVALAFIIATWTYYKNLQNQKFPMDFFVHHFWHWMLGGLLVGRIFSILIDSSIFIESPLFSFLAFWDGGISVYGFILGFTAFMWKETHAHQFGFWRWLEHLIQPLFFLLIVHDIASFTTGHLYGVETTLPWGVQYETFGVETIKPVHPVGAYGVVAHVGLYIWWVYSSKNAQISTKQSVQMLLLSLLGIDFLLQFITANQSGTFIGILKYNQLIVLILILFLTRSIWWKKPVNN